MSTIRTSDGLELCLHDWSIPEPRITVALVHGYGEHAGRYEHVAKRWNARGIAVLAADLRGHGRSEGTRGYIERFTDYHRDVDALVEAAQAKQAGGAIALFGHSMGGLISLHWVLSGRGDDLAGLVISSPFLGFAVKVGPVKRTLGDVMSSVYPKLALPSGLKGEDVARDLEIAARYDVDPLNNKKATSRWYTEVKEAIASVHRRAAQLTLPMLLLYGGDDRVALADATDRFAGALAGPDVKSERLAGLYHEILNEPPDVRNAIADRMAEWLLEHAARS